MLKLMFKIGRTGLVGVVLNFLLSCCVYATESVTRNIVKIDDSKTNKVIYKNTTYEAYDFDDFCDYDEVSNKYCLTYSDGSRVYYSMLKDVFVPEYESENIKEGGFLPVNPGSAALHYFLVVYDLILVEEYNRIIEGEDCADMVKKLKLAVLKDEDVRPQGLENKDIDMLDNHFIEFKDAREWLLARQCYDSAVRADVVKELKSNVLSKDENIKWLDDRFIKFKDAREWFEKQQFSRLFSSFKNIGDFCSNFSRVWKAFVNFSDGMVSSSKKEDVDNFNLHMREFADMFAQKNKSDECKNVDGNMLRFFEDLDELFIKSYPKGTSSEKINKIEDFFESALGFLCKKAELSGLISKTNKICYDEEMPSLGEITVNEGFVDFDLMYSHKRLKSSGFHPRTSRIFSDNKELYCFNIENFVEHYKKLCMDALSFNEHGIDVSDGCLFKKTLVEYCNKKNNLPIIVRFISLFFECVLNEIFEFPRVLDNNLFRSFLNYRYFAKCGNLLYKEPVCFRDSMNRCMVKLKYIPEKIMRENFAEGEILACFRNCVIGRCCELLRNIFNYSVPGELTHLFCEFIYKFFMDSKSEKNFYLLFLIYLINIRRYLNYNECLEEYLQHKEFWLKDFLKKKGKRGDIENLGEKKD